MAELAAHLRQFDDAWSHSFESVTSALDGLTEDEAFHQAPCYAHEEQEEGWPPPGSVAWQIAHLTHCKRHYTDILLRAGSGAASPVRPWEPLATLAALHEALSAAHAAQRAALAALREADLPVEAGNGMSYREFVVMTIRHDSWHAGQIAVARRLYRTR